MDWDLAKVLNLVGIVLEFLSFWFAAPEILGVDRLRALEQELKKGIRLLPVARAWLVGLAMVVGLVTSAAVIMVPSAAMGPLATRLSLLIVLAGLLAGLLAIEETKIALQERVIAPVLQVLADDKNEHIRRRSLVVGGVLFVIAFLCQFTAALLDISGP
jgi:hypothetical protein